MKTIRPKSALILILLLQSLGVMGLSPSPTVTVKEARQHPSPQQLFILGGELSNSAATSAADIDEVMPRQSLNNHKSGIPKRPHHSYSNKKV